MTAYQWRLIERNRNSRVFRGNLNRHFLSILLRQIPQIGQRKSNRQIRMNILRKLAVHMCKAGPPGLVSPQEFMERRFKRDAIEAALSTKRNGLVVEGNVGIRLRVKPDTVLIRRNWRYFPRTPTLDSCRRVIGARSSAKPLLKQGPLGRRKT